MLFDHFFIISPDSERDPGTPHVLGVPLLISDWKFLSGTPILSNGLGHVCHAESKLSEAGADISKYEMSYADTPYETAL